MSGYSRRYVSVGAFTDNGTTTANAMTAKGSRSWLRIENDAVDEDEERILAEFRRRYCDTGIFYDRYAGSKFADFLFEAGPEDARDAGWEATRQRIEEAQLFIEAAHGCYGRLKGGRAVP